MDVARMEGGDVDSCTVDLVLFYQVAKTEQQQVAGNQLPFKTFQQSLLFCSIEGSKLGDCFHPLCTAYTSQSKV